MTVTAHAEQAIKGRERFAAILERHDVMYGGSYAELAFTQAWLAAWFGMELGGS
jgi:hypothetical protein